VFLENFTQNNVTAYLDPPIKGNYIEGNLSSFVELDEKRYVAQSLENMTLGFNFTLQNVSRGTYESYRSLSLEDWYKNWVTEFPIFSIDIEISTKIDNIENIEKAILYLYNFSSGKWLSLKDDINITTDDETIVSEKIWDPGTLKLVLDAIDNNNNMTFKMEYNGTGGSYTVSINQFTVSIGENNTQFNTIQRYDPFLVESDSPTSYKIENGTKDLDSSLSDIDFYDNKYFKVNSDTNNLSIEFKFTNILQGIDTSLFNDTSIVDFWLKYTHQILWFIDVNLRANVSISSPNNLSYAALEIYKGTKEFDFLNETENAKEWIQIFQKNNTLAMQYPLRHVPNQIDSENAFQFIQFLNESDDNSLRLRLKYVWNSSQANPPGGFNVTVEHFKLDFYVHNAITSDIASKIGFGLNSKTLKPEDIKMKNFGLEVSNDGNQTGIWNKYIPNGIPTQNVFEFNVTSIWHAITFEVTGTYDLFKFEVNIEFDDKIKDQYMTGKNFFSVEVLDGFEDPIEGLEIIFELLDSDEDIVDEDSAVTNDEGIAKGSLEFDDVGDDYIIRVSYEIEGIYASEEIESDEFRIVDDVTLLMDTLQIYFPYIIAAIAALTIFVTVRHHKKNKLRRYWASEALILDDLLKISYIMIIHKDAGVTIYSKQISMELDSDLIGGFLTAISQFRSEIKKPKDQLAKSKGFEMDYYDFKIIINDGEVVRVALILDGIPSDKLEENHEAFTSKFEQRFRKQLDPFTGDVKPFVATNSIIESYFNLSLMYPLQLGKHWEFVKFNKLENALVEVAVEMQKERKFFFFSSLLSYGLAGRKATRDQIISTILNLKRRGIIVPVEME